MFEKVNPAPEIWKDIPGYEGHYQASSLGEIRSIKNECVLLKGDIQKNGYRRVYLWKDGKKKNCLVHRLVASAFIENPNEYTDVNHIDEDKSNNNVNNLEWCTHKYNINYGSTKEKIGAANRGRVVSKEVRQKLREDTSRKRWINDGTVERYVYVEQLFSFLSDGWKKGRLKRERICMNA